MQKNYPSPSSIYGFFSRRLAFLRPRWHCSFSCRLFPSSSFLHATLRSRNSESFERRRQRKNISSPSLAQRRNKPMTAAERTGRRKKREARKGEGSFSPERKIQEKLVSGAFFFFHPKRFSAMQLATGPRCRESMENPEEKRRIHQKRAARRKEETRARNR